MPRGKDPIVPRPPTGVTPSAVPDDPKRDATQPAAEPPAPSKPADPGWKNSSLDLVTGLEVTDFSETISGEIFDELFKR